MSARCWFLSTVVNEATFFRTLPSPTVIRGDTTDDGEAGDCGCWWDDVDVDADSCGRTVGDAVGVTCVFDVNWTSFCREFLAFVVGDDNTGDDGNVVVVAVVTVAAATHSNVAAV